MKDGYLPTATCKECGGKCCQAMGCHLAPEDLPALDIDSIRSKLSEGNLSIDWWEGDPRSGKYVYSCGYYLRMRNVGAPVVDPSWGGRCVLLTDAGCPLSFEERPKGARTLKPSNCHVCYGDYDKRQCAIDWIPHHEMLAQLAEEYTEAADDRE